MNYLEWKKRILCAYIDRIEELYTGPIVLSAYARLSLAAHLALALSAKMDVRGEAAVDMNAHLALALPAKANIRGEARIDLDAHLARALAALGVDIRGEARIDLDAYLVQSLAALGVDIRGMGEFTAAAHAVPVLAAVPKGMSINALTSLNATCARALAASFDVSIFGIFEAAKADLVPILSATMHEVRAYAYFTAAADMISMLSASSVLMMPVASDASTVAELITMLEGSSTCECIVSVGIDVTASLVNVIEATCNISALAEISAMAEKINVLEAQADIRAYAYTKMGAVLMKRAVIADWAGKPISQLQGVSIADTAYIEI